MAIDQMALIDLLTNLRNQTPPAISPDATGGSGMGTFADMMYRNPAPTAVNDPRAALMQQAFQPQEPQLLPEEPQWSKGRQTASQIGAALADALGAYAAGLGSPVRVNASQQLMDRIRMGRAYRDENARRKKSAEDEATQAKARYELGRMEEADAQKRQDDQFAKEQAARKDELLQKQAFDQAELDRRLKFEARQAELEAQRRTDLEVLKGNQDYQIEKLRQAGRETEDRVLNRQREGEQWTALKEIKGNVVNIKAQLPEMLKTQSPDQIRSMFLDAVEVQGLDGQAKQEALEFFRDRLEPLLQQADPVQGPQDDPAARTRAQQRAGVERNRAQGAYGPFMGRQ